jgi:hypothetical protein
MNERRLETENEQVAFRYNAGTQQINPVEGS